MQHYLVGYREDAYEVGNDGPGRLDTSGLISLNSAGYYLEEDLDELDKMNIVRTHGRKDYLFCYVARGQINLELDGNSYVIKKGFFIIPPDTPHHYNNKGTNTTFELYWFHFSGYYCDTLLSQCGLGSGVYDSGIIDEIHSPIRTMVRELTFYQPQFERVTESLIMYVLSLAGRRMDKVRTSEQNKMVDARMQKALEYIHLHYPRELTVQKLADFCQLSSSRFSALFKETFGYFPLQYINAFRIKRSCDLIRHTDLIISQIAEVVGFNDPLYFSRVFKKQMGVSPRQYRTTMNPDFTVDESI